MRTAKRIWLLTKHYYMQRSALKRQYKLQAYSALGIKLSELFLIGYAVHLEKVRDVELALYDLTGDSYWRTFADASNHAADGVDMLWELLYANQS